MKRGTADGSVELGRSATRKLQAASCETNESAQARSTLRQQRLVNKPYAAPRRQSGDKATSERLATRPAAHRLLVENRLVERLAIIGLPIHDELILVEELDWHRLAAHDNDAAVQVLGG